MIAYDLKCHRAHQFEAWFKNLKTFERQRKNKYIQCPLCESVEIEMVFRPQAIRKKSNLKAARKDASRILDQVHAFLRDNFEDVGKNFAEEARQVHYGESEPRNIRGETTTEEEKELVEEGITFVKIGLPKPTN